MMQNELALHSKEALEQHFAAVWGSDERRYRARHHPPKASCRANCASRAASPRCAVCW
ncbi:hypothetical protein LNQ52_15155 [Klebsiella pneumoniae subsp. pneumoniae]|nr:hypothetical protein [Klebsiella pneumoniae subsp. pneumoniae]